MGSSRISRRHISSFIALSPSTGDSWGTALIIRPSYSSVLALTAVRALVGTASQPG